MSKTTNYDYLLMVVEILHTGNWLDSKISKILGQSGITHVQFNILRILEGSHPTTLSVGSVKERILFSNSDITRLLDRLKDKGLVERTICKANRRKMDVSITPAGLNLIKVILPKIEEDLEGFYNERLNAEERDQLVGYLKRLKA